MWRLLIPLPCRLYPADSTDSDGSRRKCMCCHGGLPWWFIFFGWLLVIATSVVAGYFTMLYGLKFGKDRSISWLVSMTVSFFQSVLIIQPLKVKETLYVINFWSFNFSFYHQPFHRDNFFGGVIFVETIYVQYSLMSIPFTAGGMSCDLLFTCNEESRWGRFSKCGICRKWQKSR